MNAICYSLFGFNQKHDQCYEFRSYLRGLHLNIRVGQLLYPGWRICIAMDRPTYASQYLPYFNALQNTGNVKIELSDTAELCKMMLWRLYPMFENNPAREKPMYDRIICRDTDSLLSYRERQAVAYWESGPKMAHAITDSISHSATLMGGMIGLMSGPFRDRMGVKSFDELMALSQGIDYNRKGADQDFLNRYVLPKVADSITEHFVLGHPQTFRGDCHNFIHDIDLGLPAEFKQLDGFGFHIGAAGMQVDSVVKFLEQHGKDNEYWDELERQYPEVMYWQL